MSTFDFDEALEHYRQAVGEFVKGNPEPYKLVSSHRDGYCNVPRFFFKWRQPLEKS